MRKEAIPNSLFHLHLRTKYNPYKVDSNTEGSKLIPDKRKNKQNTKKNGYPTQKNLTYSSVNVLIP